MVESFATYEDILNIQNPQEGQIVYCEETDKKYIYSKEADWCILSIEGDNNLELSLYDINKQIISQLPPLTAAQLAEKAVEITQWKPSEFCLMYCKEVGYFTMFKEVELNGEFSTFGEAVIELIKDITDLIYSIDLTEDKSVYEIWLKYRDEVTVLYLFDFSQGLITFNK